MQGKTIKALHMVSVFEPFILITYTGKDQIIHTLGFVGQEAKLRLL